MLTGSDNRALGWIFVSRMGLSGVRCYLGLCAYQVASVNTYHLLTVPKRLFKKEMWIFQKIVTFDRRQYTIRRYSGDNDVS